ncbi:MAG: asparagine synthase C-terminal domain-containing protein [Porphyromonadaceae bacterium]|nr:asparagine synthase C-terminal domain-containing protein [Porphyromonadaceae bacterium]
MKWIFSSTSAPSITLGEAFTTSGRLIREGALAVHFAQCLNLEQWLERCDALNGCWAVGLSSPSGQYLAVDHRATRSLYYRLRDEELWVSENGFDLLVAEDYPTVPNEEIALYFSRWGFTPREETLHPEIKRLPAGYALHHTSGKGIRLARYTGSWRRCTLAGALAYEEAKRQMRILMEQAMDRMAEVIGKRTILLPLTGGRDSRLIAVSLIARGFKDQIRAFTYGRHESTKEVKRARTIAEKLGLSHRFICTIPSEYSESGYLQDPEALRYLEYICGLGSGYFFGEFTSGRHYAQTLEKECIVLPGHAGDILGGAHLQHRPKLGRNHRKGNLRRMVYFEGAGRVLDSSEEQKIADMLGQQLALYPSELNERELFEVFRTLEISSKYYINSSRGWRYWGYKVWLPYLDRDLADFVYSLPPDYRYGKRIYEELTDEYFASYGVAMLDDASEYRTSQSLSFRLKQLCRPYLGKYLSDRRQIFDSQDDMGFARLMGGDLLRQTQEHTPWKPNTINGLSFAWWLLYLRRRKI